MRMRHMLAAGICLLTGCETTERTPGGLSYVLGTDAGDVPGNLDAQLDAAWRRVGRVIDTGQCVGLSVAERGDLHSRVLVVIRGGLISYKGERYYGLTWVAQRTAEVALYNGTLPGATHELWHLVMDAAGYTDGDPDHLGPCWGSVGGIAE